MSTLCRFTAPASRDIEKIIDYIAEVGSLNAAEDLLNLINQTCRKLATFPSMGRLRIELAEELRSFPVKDYLIFYRPIEEGVEVVRVLSGYRDLTALFSEKDT